MTARGRTGATGPEGSRADRRARRGRGACSPAAAISRPVPMPVPLLALVSLGVGLGFPRFGGSAGSLAVDQVVGFLGLLAFRPRRDDWIGLGQRVGQIAEDVGRVV